jgi:hypothetical protein
MKRPVPPAYYPLIAAFILISQAAFSQRGKAAILKYDTTSYKGEVELTDGTRLEGGIVFNDNDGLVTVFYGDQSRTFNARRMVKFSFHDPAAKRVRLFYSLELNDPDIGMPDPQIVEILKTLDSFMVVSKIDRIRTETRKGILEPATSPLMVDRDSKKFTQTETVYFVNADGDFQPYLKILQKEFEGDLIDYHESSNRYLDAKLFKRYTGVHYPALVEFARENKLSFKRKSGIIRILDEYERLIKE